MAQYAGAVTKWNIAGRPVRSDALVDLIAETCCKPCQFYVDGNCNLCGCRVRTVEEEKRNLARIVISDAMLNKIRMGTEDCPDKCSCSHSRWKHVRGQCEECDCLGFARPGEARKELSDVVTVAVTAFMRPESLSRCVDSIRKFYPRIKIDVEDTEGNLSAGRNRLVSRCETEYILIMEDDMEFTEHTRIERLLDVAVFDNDLIGCGGSLREARTPWRFDWEVMGGKVRMIPTRSGILVTRKGTTYEKCQVVSNFGVFRTELLRKYPWDERLPLAEHRSWFFSWRDEWRVGYCEGCQVVHHRTRDREYSRLRARSKDYLPLADELAGVKFLPAQPEPVVQGGPFIVIMGVGHSNTTITTRQIAELTGASLADADQEYAESVKVRELNIRLIGGESVPIGEMRAVLCSLGASWVLKNPRFCLTLDKWVPAMVPYTPMLIWVRKDLDRVRQSYIDRGQNSRSVESGYKASQEQYDRWPWSKFILEADRVERAVEMFDVARSRGKVQNEPNSKELGLSNKPVKWAYGITCVPSRFSDLLPATVDSLNRAGFSNPRLFIDGKPDGIPDGLKHLELTYRDPPLSIYGNWLLSAWELMLRHPDANRFAIFQDDMLAYRNLREYLERCEYPERGYINLYTMPHNVQKDRHGWYMSDQYGKGAVGLVFSSEALRILLRQQHIVDRCIDCSDRAKKAVDGAIVEAMKKAGWQEWVHNPTLVQHVGQVSTLGHLHVPQDFRSNEKRPKHALPQANTFQGEDFDALELLR